jgi:plastocyanin
VTIQAGQAVAFTNGNGSPHTVTEGTAGQSAVGACVDEPLAVSATVIVTFYVPGVYEITCRPHPPMHTSVTVV